MKILQYLSCFVLGALMLLPAGKASAQGKDNGLESLIAPESVSEAIIRQEMHHTAPLNQAATSLSLRQNGNLNVANLAISGQGLTLSVGQNGNDNRIDMGLRGNDSRITLIQNGNFNDMLFSNVTAEGVTFEARQDNNFNKLEVDGTASGPLPNMKIEQSGGARLIISTPGDFGTGLPVSIR